MPEHVGHLLSFAGALDLDPYSIWHIDAGNYPAIHSRIHATFVSHTWATFYPALSFVEGLLTPSHEWPPPEIARHFAARRWAIFDYVQPQTDDRDFYITFCITPRHTDHEPPDQVWHFAWRPSRDTAWRPYGYVQYRDERLRLFHYNGGTTDEPIPQKAPLLLGVETWIGTGPVEFRVASLHPSAINVARKPKACSAVVRFAGPSSVF